MDTRIYMKSADEWSGINMYPGIEPMNTFAKVEDGTRSSTADPVVTEDSSLNMLADAGLASQSPPPEQRPVKTEEKEQMLRIEDLLSNKEPVEPEVESITPPHTSKSGVDQEVKAVPSTPDPPTPEPPKIEVFGEDGELLIHVGTGGATRVFQVDKGILRGASQQWRILLRTNG
jgi:hypothetical protein